MKFVFLQILESFWLYILTCIVLIILQEFMPHPVCKGKILFSAEIFQGNIFLFAEHLLTNIYIFQIFLTSMHPSILCIYLYLYIYVGIYINDLYNCTKLD